MIIWQDMRVALPGIAIGLSVVSSLSRRTARQFGGMFRTHATQEGRDLRVTSTTVKSRVADVVFRVVLERVHVDAGIDQQSHYGQMPPPTGIAEGCLTVMVPFLEVGAILDTQRDCLGIAVGGCLLEKGLHDVGVLTSIRTQAGGECHLQQVKTGRRNHRDRCIAPIASIVSIVMVANKVGQSHGVTTDQGDLQAPI